jgi:hypothetical protein
MTISYLPNMSEVAVSRLSSRTKGFSDTVAFLQALVDECQALEVDIKTVGDSQFSITNAVGVQLDILGALIGQPRHAFSDAAYRTLLNARVAANTCDGSRNAIIAIAVSLWGLTWTVTEQTASAIITANSPIADTTINIAMKYGFLFTGKPAGVRLLLNFSISSAATTFTLDGTGAQALDNGHFANSLDRIYANV